MPQTLKSRIVFGVFWQTIGNGGTQVLQFFISVCLARLLSPKEFGVVAILSVFIVIGGIILDCGWGTALVQRKELDNADCSSVFWINLVTALVLYAGLWISAPLISTFYDDTTLTPLLRVLGVVLLIGSLTIVHNALLLRRLLFNLRFRITWSALIVSGGVGIALAFAGYGVWALVFQQLSNAFTRSVATFFCIHWLPDRRFEWQKLKGLLKFGGNIFVVQLVDKVSVDFIQLLIGKMFNFETLCYYNRGNSLAALSRSMNDSICSVMFPAFSRLQGNLESLRNTFLRSLEGSIFFICYFSAFLIVMAKPLILFIYGEAWLPTVIFLQLAAVCSFFGPIHLLNLHVINSLGHSEIFLQLEITKKITLIFIIIATYRWGILCMLWGMVGYNLISFLLNAWPNIKLIQITPWQQIKLSLPSLCSTGLAMTGILFLVKTLYNYNLFWQLMISGITYSLLFFLFALLMKNRILWWGYKALMTELTAKMIHRRKECIK